MNKSLLKTNILLASLLCFISFEICPMEQQTIPQCTNSLAIMKAVVERDGDTTKRILDNTPVEERRFCLDFPEYNFGSDFGSPILPSYKINNNHFTLVDIGKKMDIVSDSLRAPINGKLYYILWFKDSNNRSHKYAIDNTTIKSKSNTGETTDVELTPLMIATYENDTKKITQELSKNVNHREVIHSLFIALKQGCLDCIKLLFSKEELIKNDEQQNCGLYRTLLKEAINRQDLAIFETLIQKNLFSCLNTPSRYPGGNVSNLRTILDDLNVIQKPSPYNSVTNEQYDFAQKCIDICKKYGVKTLNELVREGYVAPQKPYYAGDKYSPGYIND
jgi:hypothetical protein